ncbi:DUF1634 domain-containing protein [Camelliibacillus cellulosilyticus]|uniref:DUF1634 domain-containing protein n=1 Tax=Camelliibacillus cellulosilyticus TaxID=2174486 RepID=A0ABV9GME0_9BACL
MNQLKIDQTQQHESRATEESVDHLIGKLLRIGVLTSASIIVGGLSLFLVTGKSGYVASRYPYKLIDIWTGCLALKPYAIILGGLFLLILTPFFRVGAAMILYLIQKDYLYTIITALVFIILIISFFIGKAA